MKPLAMPDRLVVVPLGDLPRALLAGVGAAVTAAYGIPVAAGAAQQRPGYAYNAERRQYHATAILRRLAPLRTEHRAPVLGLADVDLFLPDAAYVLGEADRDAGCAVVSLARLGAGPAGRAAGRDRIQRRADAEAVHELGHLLGLSHCQDAHCAMFPSHRPFDADRKGGALCAGCRAALGLG